MTDTKDYNSIVYVKKKLLLEKGSDVKTLGYNLACWLGTKEGEYSLEARLQPLPGSPDPISDDLFARIKEDLEKYLRDNNENVPLNIVYDKITAR